MEIYYAGLNWKVIDVSLLFLGHLAYRLPRPARPPPHTLSYRVSNLNSAELIVLTAQDSCCCTTGLFSQQ